VQTRISVLLIPAEIKLLSAVTEIKCALWQDFFKKENNLVA
jgi:hypothetical protein